MSCNNENLFNSLEWCQGKLVIPGIRPRLYFISKRDIVKWPTLSEDAKKAEDRVTYAGNFGLAADKKWLFLDVQPDKSPVTSEAQGEIPSVTTLNKATFKHPGVKKEATAFIKEANNSDLVYLIQERTGAFRVLGNEMFNTITKASSNIGGAVTDEAGITIEVEVTDVCPAPFYTGQIETEEGIINESGAVTPEPGEE